MGYFDALQPGEQLDAYRIEEQVARSGMATIYRASDTRDGRVLAIKVPHPDIEADPVLFDRFQREAAIGQKLRHPGVMRVFGDEQRSRVYMVMEWCEGRLLREILNEGALPQDRALRIALALLDALAYIHGQGIVHRDLKPENIFVHGDSDIKLIDFGIASDASAGRLGLGLAPALGTPHYISPERAKNKRGDTRTDLYSLGVILYEMLTGTVPFRGNNRVEIIHDRLLNHPVPPTVANPALSPQLQEVLYRALERDPRKRYASAGDFARDLQHLDAVPVAQRPELRDWQIRRRYLPRKIAQYSALALIPVAILLLLLLFFRH
ncbi:MAG: serine/threonine-protein kinase [Acidobacteriota bacterium]